MNQKIQKIQCGLHCFLRMNHHRLGHHHRHAASRVL
jgi:hypothetical protein